MIDWSLHKELTVIATILIYIVMWILNLPYSTPTMAHVKCIFLILVVLLLNITTVLEFYTTCYHVVVQVLCALCKHQWIKNKIITMVN